MQGKGLALLASLCFLAAGCGGGGGSPTGAEGSQGTEAIPPQLRKLQRSAKRIEAERERQAKAPKETSKGNGEREEREGQGKPAPPPPDPTPPNSHHDRGGGTQQFQNKGGDNSIQESGHEASASDREEAAAVLHAYFDARVAHRWPDACFYMAAGLVASIEQFGAKYGHKGTESCPQVLATFAEGSSQQALSETAEVDVGSLRTEGDHGFALYYGPRETPYAMPMVRESGAWKVSSLEGAPLE